MGRLITPWLLHRFGRPAPFSIRTPRELTRIHDLVPLFSNKCTLIRKKLHVKKNFDCTEKCDESEPENFKIYWDYLQVESSSFLV